MTTMTEIRLTPGQREVVRLIADGMTRQAVAAALNKPIHYVDRRIEYARYAAGADNIPHLVALCIRNGVI